MKPHKYTQTIIWHPLYPGSRNPPKDVTILLKAVSNGVVYTGIGICQQDSDKRVYFKYDDGMHAWYGHPKSAFIRWALIG